MPRVNPEDDNGYYSQQPRHHEPNRQHYRDVARGGNQDVLVNFENYTIRPSDNYIDDRGPQRYRRSNESGEDPRSYGRPKSRDRESGRATSLAGQNSSYPENKKSGFVVQWDILSFVILFAYILCIIITALAIWCYKQDSMWNTIVRAEQAFPTLSYENFFGGKFLYVYNTDASLRHAKKNLLRENRWLELAHIMFMCAFLILTLFQFFAYVTRGQQDHSKLIICYYTIFGGLGLIIGLFPLLSWHDQENNYKVAAHYLHDFARRVWQTNNPKVHPGASFATAQDAYTLGGIMKFCYDVSQEGVTLDEDTRHFPHLKRYYRLSNLQHLGFCTYHKVKIVNTILSIIFALICCAIPCIFCYQLTEKEKAETAKTMQRGEPLPQTYEMAPTPVPYYDEVDGGGEQKRSQKSLSGLSRAELKQLALFKQYIEADSGED